MVGECGLANIGQRDLHPLWGTHRRRLRNRHRQPRFYVLPYLFFRPQKMAGTNAHQHQRKNKKISGYTVRGSGSCGWGTPTPSRAYVYRFCNLLKYKTLRGFSPHNNPDGEIIPRLFCLIEHPIKTVRQPTGCNREPPVFTPVRLRWCNRTADVTPSRLWWLFLWWFPLRLQA